MRYYRRALIVPWILGLVTTACEPNNSMSVESAPSDSLITTHGLSLDRLINRLDSTIVYVNGVRVDSPVYENFDLKGSVIEAVRVFQGSDAVERFGSIAEGRIVKEYTVRPKGEPQKPD